jgi:hypothetical protein
MNLKSMRLLGLFALMAGGAAFAIACSGGGGGGDSSSGDSTLGNEVPSLEGKSTAQNMFVSTRGNPEMFSIGYVTEELQDGAVVPSSPRRIETWIFNEADAVKTALFDDGFFVSESVVGSHDPGIVANSLRPDQFVLGMSRGDVAGMLGEPSCEQAFDLAGKSYLTMRFNPVAGRPATSVALENGQLIAVNSGYAVAETPTNTLCQ